MGTIKDHLKQIADLTKGSNQSEYNERRYNLAHEVEKGIKTSSEYVSIAEYSKEEVMKAILDMGCYDDPFRYYFVTKVLGRSW